MSGQRVLLTGFPRCEIARRVLSGLLADSSLEEVHCLVPGRYTEIAAEWINALPPAQRPRVRVWLGDVASIDFGLSGADFRTLGARVNVIHHCAAVTYTGAPLPMAEAVNIGGTYEALEFARNATALSRFVHWSLAAVSAGREGVVYEDDLSPPRGGPLLETRYRAERAVRVAMKELPAIVLRPAMLVGDSQTGRLERIEGAHLLISGLLSAPRDVPVPRPARADSLLHIVPIDYAVRAGLVLADAPEAAGRTFQIVDPMPPTLREALTVIAELVQRPPPRGALPGPIARALLRLPGIDQFAHAERALIEELDRVVSYSDLHARPILARAGLSCPPFVSYVGKLVAYVERMRRPGERAVFPAQSVL